jgi:tetratricopeptide (TPR) repeat protein
MMLQKMHLQQLQRFLPLLVVIVGVIAYSNSFPAGFVFDDFSAIVNNPQICGNKPLELHSRIVANFTFRLNYLISGCNPADFRATNVLIHIIAGLFLYGIIRRTLLLPFFQEQYKENAGWIAIVIASLWVAHPIQTESVTYICQRYESLMGLFYLLTVYCFIRGVNREGRERNLWFTGSVVSVVAGMGIKEVMITAPLVVFLYDWMFVTGSPISTFRQRKLFYIFLFGSMFICVVLTIVTLSCLKAKTGRTLSDLPAIWYFATQPGVILHYIKLAIIPFPLCLDYGWEVAETAREILPPVIVLTAAGLLSLLGLIKRSPVAFPGCVFFIILAPTSSFMPVGDIAFEHRMYLPLACVLILLVFAVIWIVDKVSSQIFHKEDVQIRLKISLAILSLTVCIALTLYRNYQYLSPVRLWSDAVKQRPYNLRAHLNLCNSLKGAGLYAEAEKAARQALLNIEAIRAGPRRKYEHLTRVPERYEHTIYNTLGTVMYAQGKYEEAIRAFQTALKIEPSYDDARYKLALTIAITGRSHEAREIIADLMKRHPEDARMILTMGIIVENEGKFEDAIRYYRQARERAIGTDLLQANSRLAWLLATAPDDKLRSPEEAVRLAEAVCKATEYKSWRALDILASACAGCGEWEKAIQLSKKALEILRNTTCQQQFAKEVEIRLQSYISRKPWYISPSNTSSSTSTELRIAPD